MINKSINLIGMFALILFAISFASATIAYPSVVNNSQGYFNITFSINNTDVNPINVSFNGSTVLGVSSSFADLSNVTVQNGTTTSFVKRVNFNSSATGSIVGFLFINGSSNSFSVTIQQTPSATPSSVINATKVCKYDVNGSDLLSITDIVDQSDLDNEWEWKPLDNVKIEVEIENNGEKDNEDYTISLLFFDSSGKDVTSDVVDNEDDVSVDYNNLDSGKHDTVTFNFLVSGNVEENEYTMVIKLVKSGKEREQCVYNENQDVSIARQDRQIIVKSIEAPITSNCGDTIQLDATIANIGTEDEDRVKIRVYNQELGINLFKEIDNLDSGDTQLVSLEVPFPINVASKVYKLLLTTEYDYDDQDETYDEQSASEDDKVTGINLLDNCVDTTKPTITAKLGSTAKVGEAMNITLSIKNNANAQVSMIVTADSYDSWATLMALTPSSLTLAKSETKNTVLTLKPTSEGQQTFVIKAVYNGKTIEQPITVTVESGSNWTSNLKSLTTGENSMTFFLVAGIILIVLAIVVVLLVRAFRKSSD